jgi:hypothetical protein
VSLNKLFQALDFAGTRAEQLHWLAIEPGFIQGIPVC